MKKKILIVLLLFLLILTSCKQKFLSQGELVDEYIQPPKISELPLKGTWKLVDIVEMGNQTALPAFSKDEKLYVSEDLVAIGDFYTVKPNFSSKFVNTKKYLDTRFKDKIELKDFHDDNIELLIVRDNDNFNCDLLHLAEDRIAFFYESRFYYLEKYSDLVSSKIKENYQKKATKLTISQSKDPENLVLTSIIGLKVSQETHDGYPYFNYYSYIIQEDYRKKMANVLKLKDLLLFDEELEPSKLTYRISKTSPSLGVVDAVFQYGPLDENNNEKKEIFYDSYHRSITFIHGNLISFDRYSSPLSRDDDLKQYELYSLDQLASSKPYTVEKFAGKEEAKAFRAQILDELSYIDPDGRINREEVEIIDTNLGIVRQNNVWGFVTTKSWTMVDTVYPLRIPINLVPLLPITDQDSLQIPWSKVTTKIPLAKTAFTSPHGERLMVFTDDEIQYYKLFHEKINSKLDFSIQLPEKSEVIMVEHYYGAKADSVNKWIEKEDFLQPQVLYNK